jgi:hypothetical protein
MPTPADAITNYILAKDGNRPFLMRQAFAGNAVLEMVVKTDAISFPSTTRGVDGIAEVIVRRFAQDYENIYTFCLAEPPATQPTHFPCHWLAGMSARSDGQIRVGCGRYDWYFDRDGFVEKLVVAIEVMKVLPAQELSASMNWLSALSYPWCSVGEMLRGMPASDGLAAIKGYLQQAGPLVPAQ